jgi:N-acetylneuraminate synthase
LLERIAAVDKPIIASAAGACLEDLDRVVSFFDHRQKALTLMHCVAQYPTATKDLQLNQIEFMRRRYPLLRIGFSTHEDPADTEVILVAIGKGASVFERHVAVPTERYASNAYSSTPAQLRAWLAAARKGFDLCGLADERVAGTLGELAQLGALRRGVFARRKLEPGRRLTEEDYFLAMPSTPGQLVANDLSKYRAFTTRADVEANAPVLESAVTQVDHQSSVRAILQDVKKLLKKSHITLPSSRSDLEISHHYGLERFHEYGAVMLSFVNREYCKKVLVMVPNQRHPEHAHKQKEETFYVDYGDITITLDGEEKSYRAGDLILVKRGVKHGFSTKHGVIFEEISSTHYKNDSYYTDPAVMQNGNRKTLLTYWMD